MIVKYGSENVTVRRIADAVGISEAAIYRHFKSKRDILYVLADLIQQNRVGDIERAIENHQSSLATVESLMRDHISAIEQRHGISHQVIAEIISLGDKDLNRRYYEIVTTYIDRLAELIRLGMKSGELREDIDPQTAALQLYGMIDGLVSMWALGNFSFNLVARYEPLWGMFRDSVSRRPLAAMSQ